MLSTFMMCNPSHWWPNNPTLWDPWTLILSALSGSALARSRQNLWDFWVGSTQLIFPKPDNHLPPSWLPATPTCWDCTPGRIWDRLSCVTLAWRKFFLLMPDWWRAFFSHDQILVCLDLIKFASITLMTPWDPAQAQSCVSTQQVVASYSIPWNICWVASDPALAQTLN